MFKSGVGFLALFGLGRWLLGTSAVGGVARLAEVVVGCAVTLGLMLAARSLLPSSAGGAVPRRPASAVQPGQRFPVAADRRHRRGVRSRRTAGAHSPPVAIVFGRRFLPLAAVFEQPRPGVPAALLTAAGASGTAVWLTDGPGGAVRLAVGPLSALSLWGTAIRTITESATAAEQDVRGWETSGT